MPWGLCGSRVSVGWVERNVAHSPAGASGGGAGAAVEERSGHLIVFNAERQAARLSVYYPPQLAAFFSDASLRRAFERHGFLGKVLVEVGTGWVRGMGAETGWRGWQELAGEVGAIHFLERRQLGGRVPCRRAPPLHVRDPSSARVGAAVMLLARSCSHVSCWIIRFAMFSFLFTLAVLRRKF